MNTHTESTLVEIVRQLKLLEEVRQAVCGTSKLPLDDAAQSTSAAVQRKIAQAVGSLLDTCDFALEHLTDYENDE